ncbi:MAG: tetratricopeptide repeat protein [Planctomycetota bacterium]
MLLVLALCLCFGSGCRTLRRGRDARNLGAARQLSLRGAALLQQEHYAEASPVFEEALLLSPADERAQWGMAEVLWRAGKREEAIQHQQAAIELSGDNPDLLVRLGEMHLELGNLPKALQQAELVLRENRQHEGAWALQGRIRREEGRNQDAMDCYQRALIYNPNNVKARIAVADIYRDLGKPQRALATIEWLADSQLESIPARAWMLKGQALADLDQPADAGRCLKEAMLCADEDCDLLLDLAQLQYAKGNLADARICLGRALQNNPQNPQALTLQQAFDQPHTRLPGGLVTGPMLPRRENQGRN